jgi:hypothetical protein
MIAKCLNCNRDYDQETQGAICPHEVGGPNRLPPWPKLPKKLTLEGHLEHVQQFLQEMYATMIDSVEQPKLTVAEMCELLLKTAREQREQLASAPSREWIKTLAELVAKWRERAEKLSVGFAKMEDSRECRILSSCANEAEEIIKEYLNSKGETTMQPHQERVVAEKSELDGKLEKLLAFIDCGKGAIYSTLVTEERERLTTQARIMKEYSDVLADRIAAF